MKTMRALFVLLASSSALAGCADDYHGVTPFYDSRAYCGEVAAADAPWTAGCAVRHNLAVLAAEPDDLILPRPEEPRALTHHDRIFDGYGQSPRLGLRPARTQTANASEPLPIAGNKQ